MVDVPPSQSRLTNYFHLAGMTILYYDHLITFGDEYWRIWRNLRSPGSWYFMLNRYFAFFGWSVIGPKADVSLVEGCHISLNRIKAIRTAVSWEALFAYDVLIVSLTWFKAHRERSRRRGLDKNDLFGLIVRDGAIYFAIMAGANLLNTLTFYILAPALRGMLSTLATSISVTMMSRLMFNLRQGASMSKHNYETTVPTSNIRFKHRRHIPSSTDEEETLPTVQYDTQPPLFDDPQETQVDRDIEMGTLPAIEEVAREE
ncbi:hypothetical protein NM688_g385 [Phlebia brevispora]|uniref:Uncharacterized protein n=1 Tax=Phlebia brevispora TaxID=194682 RepID=A0ACC1TEG9_9APHY|nr:hypothetical protein NM688_g385 [Phlebia brevispora]